jgi:hypothetical protein
MWRFIFRGNTFLPSSAGLKGPSHYEEFLQSSALLLRELGMRKTVVHVSLVIIMATVTGMIFGAISE